MRGSVKVQSSAQEVLGPIGGVELHLTRYLAAQVCHDSRVALPGCNAAFLNRRGFYLVLCSQFVGIFTVLAQEFWVVLDRFVGQLDFCFEGWVADVDPVLLSAG